jgi:hypothetical protein
MTVPDCLPSEVRADISGALFSRRSSAVEHPLRKRVVGGSNPSAGTVHMARDKSSLRVKRLATCRLCNCLKCRFNLWSMARLGLGFGVRFSELKPVILPRR